MSDYESELKPEQYPPAPSAEDVQMAMRILAQLEKPAPLAAGQQGAVGSEFDLATILQDHNQRLKVLEAMPDKVKYAPGWSAEADGKLRVGLRRGIKIPGVELSHSQYSECATLKFVNTTENQVPLRNYELRQLIGGFLEILARMEAGGADV